MKRTPDWTDQARRLREPGVGVVAAVEAGAEEHQHVGISILLD